MDTTEMRREIAVEPLQPAVGAAPLHTLRGRGALPPGWAGKVAAELAARRISVVRGRARRHGPAHWEAELEVAPPPGTRIDGIDLVALASSPTTSSESSTGVALTSFTLEEAPGELVVGVRGRDEIGFLDRIHGVFALFALFPHELELDTQRGEAVDVFRLRALGDRAPPPVLAAALRGMLERLVET